jgi:hypothetical protein
MEEVKVSIFLDTYIIVYMYMEWILLNVLVDL